MNTIQPTQDQIDREALRLCNLDRWPSKHVRFLDTLNPEAQERFRFLAMRSLGVAA